jgi:hypothetical protein
MSQDNTARPTGWGPPPHPALLAGMRASMARHAADLAARLEAQQVARTQIEPHTPLGRLLTWYDAMSIDDRQQFAAALRHTTATAQALRQWQALSHEEQKLLRTAICGRPPGR